MTFGLVALFSTFGTIIIFLRRYFISVNDVEKQTGFILLYILIGSFLLSIICLYISGRTNKEKSQRLIANFFNAAHIWNQDFGDRNTTVRLLIIL